MLASPTFRDFGDIIASIRDYINPPPITAPSLAGFRSVVTKIVQRLPELTSASQSLLSNLGGAAHPAISPSRVPISYLSYSSVPSSLNTYHLVTTVVLLAVIFAVSVGMSWGSRFGSWGGRFSPFGRSGAPAGETKVTEDDFSYITSADLAAESHGQHSAGYGPDDSVHQQHSRDTDVLIFKHKRVSYPVHFPAYSIDNAELTIGDIRAAAARKLGVADPSRVKLLYRGRNLRTDGKPARDVGLHSGSAGEIMCVVGATSSSQTRDGHGGRESSNDFEETDADHAAGFHGDDADDRTDNDIDDDDMDGDSVTQGPSSSSRRKRLRHRGKRKRKSASATNTASSSGPTATSSIPITPHDKLDALAATFHNNLLPQCLDFTSAPPTDKGKRDFEHKRLTESILAQVLLKVDAVETDGDEGARKQRKAIVKECQEMLNRLDELIK